MTIANKISTYIRTGYLLHVITLAELAALYILLQGFHLWAWVMERNTGTRFLILLPVLWSPIFPELDARSRFQDYKMMRDYFYRYGFDARLVKRFAKSRCQRDAVLVAAREMGFQGLCRNYFKSCGYRWYHIFPDIIFEKPLVLLQWAFYSHTFFAKTYHPKFVYSAANEKLNKRRTVQVNAA